MFALHRLKKPRLLLRCLVWRPPQNGPGYPMAWLPKGTIFAPLTALLLALGLGNALAERRVAQAVGSSSFEEANPADDANDVAAALLKRLQCDRERAELDVIGNDLARLQTYVPRTKCAEARDFANARIASIVIASENRLYLGVQSDPKPVRTIPIRPDDGPVADTTPTAGTAGEGYMIHLSSQKSEEGAQASFRSLQAKFPDQLGGRSPTVRRVDLGDRGVFYRALIGPFGSSAEAMGFCNGLKAAGGTCIIQRN
jgi:hypothetical protein